MEGIELLECLLNDELKFVGIFELLPLLLLGGIISMGIGVRLVASEWCSDRKFDDDWLVVTDEDAEDVEVEEKGFLEFSFNVLEEDARLPCRLDDAEDGPPNVMLLLLLDVDRFCTPWLPWWWSEEKTLVDDDEEEAVAIVVLMLELMLLLLLDDDVSLFFEDFDDFSLESRDEKEDE